MQIGRLISKVMGLNPLNHMLFCTFVRPKLIIRVVHPFLWSNKPFRSLPSYPKSFIGLENFIEKTQKASTYRPGHFYGLPIRHPTNDEHHDI